MIDDIFVIRRSEPDDDSPSELLLHEQRFAGNQCMAHSHKCILDHAWCSIHNSAGSCRRLSCEPCKSYRLVLNAAWRQEPVTNTNASTTVGSARAVYRAEEQVATKRKYFGYPSKMRPSGTFFLVLSLTAAAITTFATTKSSFMNCPPQLHPREFFLRTLGARLVELEVVCGSIKSQYLLTYRRGKASRTPILR